MGNSPRVGKFTGPKDKGQGRHHGESEGALKRERKREKGVEERERGRDRDKDIERAQKCLDYMGKSFRKELFTPRFGKFKLEGRVCQGGTEEG